MTIEDQIKAIEDEIQKTPYNKNTQHHIGKLKAKMARLKEELQLRQLKSGGGGPGYAVKTCGHATVGLVGFPSTGKSTLLNQITDAVSEVAAYAFTTVTVIPGLMEYRGAKIQVLDMPGLIHGASKGKGRGREVLSVTRSCDMIIMMVTDYETNVQVLEEELYLANIRLNQKPADVVISKANRGGLTVNPTVKLKSIDVETIADIWRERGVLNGTVVVREDITADGLVDVLAGGQIYLPSFVVLHIIDVATPDYPMTVEARL